LPFNPFAAIALAQTTAPPDMYDPDKIGTLTPDQKKDMWNIFAYIGQRWQNASFNTVRPTQLDKTLDLKTQHTPSYYTEYTSASTLLHQLIRKLSSLEAALQYLFTHAGSDSNQQQHAYTYVVSEFILLQVALGGFRKWGYVNYKGYAGGPFNNPSKLPYRAYKG
jgi:hypothetical protein